MIKIKMICVEIILDVGLDNECILQNKNFSKKQVEKRIKVC